MSALLAVLLATAPCFTSTDATPGWKQVVLPDEARSLAAPRGIPWFRTDGQVSVIDRRSALYLAGEGVFPGRTAFDFPLGEGGRSLEVHFERPLRGAKVDVTAWTAEGAMLTLMHERRLGGETLALSWGASDVRRVRVVVHEHLRESPVVSGYTSVRRLPGSSLHASPAFGLARSLYYLQPLGPPVTLCDDAGVEPEVPPNAPPSGALPTPVSLHRL